MIQVEDKIRCVDESGLGYIIVAYSQFRGPETPDRRPSPPRSQWFYGLEGLPYIGIDILEDGQAFRFKQNGLVVRRVASLGRPGEPRNSPE